MAKTITEFTIKRRGREGEKIDFDKYLNGAVWELVEGRDFKIKLVSFRARVTEEAKKRGGKLESRTDGAKTIQLRYDSNNKK